MIIDYCKNDSIDNIINAVEANLDCFIVNVSYNLFGNKDYYKNHKIKRYYNLKAIRIIDENRKEKLTIRIGCY